MLNIADILEQGKLTKRKELELWKSTRTRYSKMHLLTDKICDSLNYDGSTELGVLGCAFCLNDTYRESSCVKCPWASVFGVCRERDSSWYKLFLAYRNISGRYQSILSVIDTNIARLERRQ